jgi:hypothetical protein
MTNSISAINRCKQCKTVHDNAEQLQYCALVHFIAYIGRVDSAAAEIAATKLVEFVGGNAKFILLHNEVLANFDKGRANEDHS